MTSNLLFGGGHNRHFRIVLDLQYGSNITWNTKPSELLCNLYGIYMYFTHVAEDRMWQAASGLNTPALN